MSKHHRVSNVESYDAPNADAKPGRYCQSKVLIGDVVNAPTVKHTFRDVAPAQEY